MHFLATLPVAGASRGLHDPLLQAAREIGMSALLMSGDRSEGQLFPASTLARSRPAGGSGSAAAKRPI